MSASIPAPQQYRPARITLRDEADLTWFFCHGEAEFQRSVHGAMTDRLERDSMGANRCFCCHGSGIVEDERALRLHMQRGRGAVWREARAARGPLLGSVVISRVNASVTRRTERAVRPPGDPIWTTETVTSVEPLGIGFECEFCRGTGWIPAKRLKPRCDPEFGGCWGKGAAARAACRLCLGTGTPQVDARPVFHAAEGGGVEAEHDTLKRFAAISRRLSRIRRCYREVLCIHHGPEGRSWADQPRGAILGLEAHTQAGRKLLERTRVAGDDATDASPAERIAGQDALEASKPLRWRRELLDAAARQAEALLAAAHAAWVGSADDDGTPPMQALEDAIDATGRAWLDWLDRYWVAGVDVDEQGVSSCG